jgi:hypothetical protein
MRMKFPFNQRAAEYRGPFYLPISGDRFPSAQELQLMYEASLRNMRTKYGAAPTTVEALMYSLRERGMAALAERQTQQRLSEMSTAQIKEVIARLVRLRLQYPKITDELISYLGEQV